MPVAPLSTGIDLYYESHGAGESLILIPGTGFPADVWKLYQVPELARSLQVVIFDPRGTGRTTHWEGVYTIDQMGADVLALMDYLGLRAAHVLGHSMGGRMGLWMALTFPRRVSSLILAASGSGAAARPGELCIPGISYDFLIRVMREGYENHIRHSLMGSSNYFTDDFRRDRPDVVQAAFNLTWPHHAAWPEFLRQCQARDAWEATHRLSDLTVPTLVTIGTGDHAGASHVRQAEVLRREIRNVEYRELPDLSHGFFWQAPEETNAWILDWVQRHAGAAS